MDFAASFVWYKRAADAGHVIAQSCLGMCYRSGHGVAQDDAASFKWYKRAADAGQVDVLGWVGMYYSEGRGVA